MCPLTDITHFQSCLCPLPKDVAQYLQSLYSSLANGSAYMLDTAAGRIGRQLGTRERPCGRHWLRVGFLPVGVRTNIHHTRSFCSYNHRSPCCIRPSSRTMYPYSHRTCLCSHNMTSSGCSISRLSSCSRTIAGLAQGRP
jgi:hypothetical protein